MRKNLLALAVAATCALAIPASAHEVVYTTLLLGSNENPVNASPATGMATVTFDLDLFTMRVEASFSGLLGTISAAHIHCCAAPPTNVGVATQTPTFTGFPSGVSAGSYDHTFDMTQLTSYNAAFVNNATNGGSISTAFSTLLAGMDSGMAYLNLHTNLFPGGEIRGHLAAAPVPEPASYAFMGAGLAVLALLKRRRR